MSANTEFALQHCLDDDTFVTAIGDDDGILPGGLAYANSLLDQHGDVDALTWMISNYCWPNCLVEDWRNTIHLSVSKHTELLSAPEMLAKMADYRVYYHHLPGLWTSFVSARLLRECKARLGRVIISPIPDCASAVVVACSTAPYIFTHRSVTLLGSSSHSTGLSAATQKTGKFEQFLAENTIPHHRDIDHAPHGVYYVTESLLQARDLGLLPSGIKINLPKALRLMLVRNPTDSDELYASIRKAAESTAARHGIAFDYEEMVKQNEEERAAELLFKDPIIADHTSIWSHRCDPRLTSNIFDATRLAGESLGWLQKKNRDDVALACQNELNQNLMLKLDKCKKRNSKLEKRLEKKLESAKTPKKQGILGRLREVLRALRGKSH